MSLIIADVESSVREYMLIMSCVFDWKRLERVRSEFWDDGWFRKEASKSGALLFAPRAPGGGQLLSLEIILLFLFLVLCKLQSIILSSHVVELELSTQAPCAMCSGSENQRGTGLLLYSCVCQRNTCTSMVIFSLTKDRLSRTVHAPLSRGPSICKSHGSLE